MMGRNNLNYPTHVIFPILSFTITIKLTWEKSFVTIIETNWTKKYNLPEMFHATYACWQLEQSD